MNSYSQYRNRILLTAFGLSITLAALAGGMGRLDAAQSLLAGGFVGLMNFFLLAREIHKFTPGPGLPDVTKNLMITSAFRYGVMFVGFAVCAGKNWFTVLPFCVGVFLTQLTIVANAFLTKEKEPILS